MRISFSMKLKNLIIDTTSKFSFNDICKNFSFGFKLSLERNCCKDFSVESMDFANFQS